MECTQQRRPGNGVTELGLGPEGRRGLSSGREDSQQRLEERGLEEGRIGSAGSAREGQRSQALAPHLGDPAGARRPWPLGGQLGLSEECGRGMSSETTTHTVHGEDLGPDEDKQGPQLPGRALEQFQHVREDAHGQGLRESRASASQGHTWEGDGNGCALLPARGFP